MNLRKEQPMNQDQTFELRTQIRPSRINQEYVNEDVRCEADSRRPAACANQPNTQITYSAEQNRALISSTPNLQCWDDSPTPANAFRCRQRRSKDQLPKRLPLPRCVHRERQRQKAPSYIDASTVSPRVTYYTYKANWPN
jgi:hypothetical protein